MSQTNRTTADYATEYRMVRATVQNSLDSLRIEKEHYQKQVARCKNQLRDSEARLSELTAEELHLAAFLERTS